MTKDERKFPTPNEARDLVKKLIDVGEKSGFDVLSGQEAIDFMNKEMNKPEHIKARKESEIHNKRIMDDFYKKPHKYAWQTGMHEISGFGGSYERGCQTMLIAGLEYLDENPQLKPVFKGYKGLYGIMDTDNEDAKNLRRVVIDVVDGDCTGAMFQAVISAILWIRNHGWDKYVEVMKK